MPATTVGLIFYGDDLFKTIVRRIYPIIDDGELYEPCPCGCGGLHWSAHLATERTPTMLVVPIGDPRVGAKRLVAPCNPPDLPQPPLSPDNIGAGD